MSSDALRDPIPRRKLAQDIHDRLIARIKSGEIAPGMQLPSERDLMETYAVGRPATREALQMLERSGLISISHGERARVLLPTPGTILERMGDAAETLLRLEPGSLNHLREARVFLETGLARLAAERHDANQIAALEKCLANHRNAGMTDFLGADIAFHHQIAVMSGNPIFVASLSGMLSWLSTSYRSLVRLPGAEAVTLAEHQAILDAIKARDAELAARAMETHLMRVNALYDHAGAGL